ncbi:MAG TPA: hypothetical protein ENI61_01965, partial [Ignavibacteria bacterium]|nr:hypothetical protein [Ignavibacteria bacterium]
VKVITKSRSPKKRITHLNFDNKNKLWISVNGEGIYLLENEKYVVFPWNEKLPFKNIRSVFFDSENRLWVGTNKGVIVIYNYDSVKKYSYKFITKKIIRTFAEDENLNIWMGSTQNGIFIYNKGQIIKFNFGNKLSDKGIIKIATYGKEVWVGTLKGGINLLIKSQIHSLGMNNGFKNDYINSVYEDKNGEILIGTRKGIYKLEKPLISNSVKKLKILENEHIFAINRSNENELILGTRYNGLFIIGKHSIKNHTIADGLKSNFVRAIYVDNDDSIWIGTNAGGVSILKGNKIENLKIKKNLSSDLISFIHKSKDGKYWIGTSGGGVNIVDNKGNVKYLNKTNGLKGNIISSIAEDDAGDIWLSINGGGLALIKDNKIHTFTTAEGLYTNTILNILVDKNKNIWCSTPYGIFKITKNSIDNYLSGKVREIKYRNFDKSDGMISDKSTGASPQTASITSKGILLFSTMYGLVLVNPNSIFEETNKIKLYIDKIIINNSNYNPEEVYAISPNPDRVEFRFGLIDFKNPSKVNYKYKLIGFDKSWIDLMGNKNIVYTHLPYGKYKLKIIGFDKGNKKNLVSIEKEIFIEPYFWETLTFRIISPILLILFLIFLTKYIVNKKHERKIKLIEAACALENERMRISRDMHDEFGLSLSKINLLTEIVKQNISDKIKTNKIINEISLSGRSLAESMDEIVWAVNPKNDRLDKMLYYLTNFFENYLTLTTIQFKYKIPDEIPSVFVSAEFRHNIFCVIKEGINNSIKHSGASLIELIFEYNAPELNILLIDNGKGIDKNKIFEFRNGIKNMTKRIDLLGGNLEINNVDTGGVKLDIRLTLKMTQK